MSTPTAVHSQPAHRARSPLPADLEPALAPPSDIAQAFSSLDAIARYCVDACALIEPCEETDCRAFVAERAAAEYLAGRLDDLQD